MLSYELVVAAGHVSNVGRERFSRPVVKPGDPFVQPFVPARVVRVNAVGLTPGVDGFGEVTAFGTERAGDWHVAVAEDAGDVTATAVPASADGVEGTVDADEGGRHGLCQGDVAEAEPAVGRSGDTDDGNGAAEVGGDNSRDAAEVADEVGVHESVGDSGGNGGGDGVIIVDLERLRGEWREFADADGV